MEKETKQAIRRRILELRNQVPFHIVEEKSQIIMNKVLTDDYYGKAKHIVVYVDYCNEVRTKDFIQKSLSLGKKVYCPKVMGEKMEFYQINSLQELQIGYKGIWEPEAKEENVLILDDKKPIEDYVMLMPGVAFTKEGKRLGYGKGFYDRFLANYPYLRTIAVCLDCQLVDELPAEPTDILPHRLYTETHQYKLERKDHPMTDLKQLGEQAISAKYNVQNLSAEEKNKALVKVADALEASAEVILKANEQDIEMGKENGMHPGMIDRLSLTKERIGDMAQGLRQISLLEDPIGELLEEINRPNGLHIEKRRVAIGVIGIIYESRPNVTVDAFGLCFKTGNAVVLKGGSDAIHSNIAIADCIREALFVENISKDVIQMIEDTSRDTTNEFMKMNQYIDVLIPRGGAGLIHAVVENSRIPVIETGTGNCHVYVDEFADFQMAIGIILNAKTQRIGVCNACESLVVHNTIAPTFFPLLTSALKAAHVEIRGDETAGQYIEGCIPATEEDFSKEYLDYIISVKTVNSIEEAIAHINQNSTKHSDVIITEDKAKGEQFLNEVDAACVYVNASSRFSDGFEFGFGAEIGISTQKIHARGPMGLKELTSYKYRITGNGQTR